jgi:chorismate dehydratase
MNNSPLRFGVLSYVNCLPATLALESGRVGDPRLVLSHGSPAELNAMMAAGELDVSLVSTAEFLDRRPLYQRLPDFSLWCDGWVESVTLHSPYDKEQLASMQPVFAVTPESATSVILLQLLLPNAQTVTFESLRQAQSGLEDGTFQGVLFIGDRALQPPEWAKEMNAHDLGQWWTERTGLPMTFAVWVARAELDPERVKLATSLLAASREWGQRLEPELLAEGERRSGVDQERLRRYFGRLQYQTTARSAEGLIEFGGRLVLNRLIGRPPALAGR